MDSDTFYSENPGLLSLHNQTTEERQETLQNAGLDPNDYDQQLQAWRGGFSTASSRLSQAEQEGNLADVAATMVGEAGASNNLGLLNWLATHASLENVTFTYTDAEGAERQVSAHEYINAVAIPRVQARTYTGGDITEQNAGSAWNSNLDTVTGALDTLNDPNATPEQLQQAGAALNGLADAFDGSGFERTWDHDNDEDTPNEPITAAEQLRKWASYAGERAASIYTDGDITEDNAGSAWNSNLDTVTGALDTLSDPNATPEQLQQAAATLNGLADAFDGSGFERAWDHDDDEDTPDQPITAAEQLRKWAGYAGDRAGSIYTGDDITAENPLELGSYKHEERGGPAVTKENAHDAWEAISPHIDKALEVYRNLNSGTRDMGNAAGDLIRASYDFRGKGVMLDHDDNPDTPPVDAGEWLYNLGSSLGKRQEGIMGDYAEEKGYTVEGHIERHGPLSGLPSVSPEGDQSVPVNATATSSTPKETEFENQLANDFTTPELQGYLDNNPNLTPEARVVIENALGIRTANDAKVPSGDQSVQVEVPTTAPTSGSTEVEPTTGDGESDDEASDRLTMELATDYTTAELQSFLDTMDAGAPEGPKSRLRCSSAPAPIRLLVNQPLPNRRVI